MAGNLAQLMLERPFETIITPQKANVTNSSALLQLPNDRLLSTFHHFLHLAGGT